MIFLLEEFKEHQKATRRSGYGHAVGGIIHALRILSSSKRKNIYYKINHLGKELFTDLFEYMLFHKPQNKRMPDDEPIHDLLNIHHSRFEKGLE